MIGGILGGCLQHRAAMQMAEMQRQHALENQQAVIIDAMRLRAVARKYPGCKRVWYVPDMDCYRIICENDSIVMEPAPRKRNPVPRAFARFVSQ